MTDPNNSMHKWLHRLRAFFHRVLDMAAAVIAVTLALADVMHWEQPTPQPPRAGHHSFVHNNSSRDCTAAASATMILLNKPTLPYDDTRTATTPHLLHLPTELMESILFHLKPNHSPALLAFALTCQSAASISLPILYASIRLSSLATLAPLSSCLRLTPLLAIKLVTITASPHFIHHNEYAHIQHALTRYTPHDELNFDALPEELASYLHTLAALTMLPTRLEKQCTPDQLASLPLPRLTALAHLCPNLTTVNLSALPVDTLLPPFITFGARNLLLLLRQRKGRFHGPACPFSSICLTLAVEAPPKVHGIVGVDWGGGCKSRPTIRQRRQVLTVICMKSATWLKGWRYPVDYCLIPIHEFVEAEEMQRGQWTVDFESFESSRDE